MAMTWKSWIEQLKLLVFLCLVNGSHVEAIKQFANTDTLKSDSSVLALEDSAENQSQYQDYYEYPDRRDSRELNSFKQQILNENLSSSKPKDFSVEETLSEEDSMEDSLEGFQNDMFYDTQFHAVRHQKRKQKIPDFKDEAAKEELWRFQSPSTNKESQHRRHEKSANGEHRFSSSRRGTKKKQKSRGTLYTKWSKWSRCSRHCQQTRRRRCKVATLCGTALIKEKRPCVGWRCQHEKFHLIKPEEIHHSHSVDEQSRVAPRADVRVLLNYNSMFYTKWSQWAACSQSCLTSRYRSCRYPLFCGNAVIREEAYCYVKETACESWYHRHKLSPDSRETQLLNEGRSVNGTLDSSSSQKQVVFGHNKYITENLPISPEDSAHILNINMGIHRFGSGAIASSNNKKNRPFASFGSTINNKQAFNNDVLPINSDKSNQLNEKSRWMNLNEATKPEILSDFSKGFSSSANEGSQPLKPGRINNIYSSTNKLKNKHTGDSLMFSSYPSLARQDVLPENCGQSKVDKPKWSLKIIGGRESTPDKWPWQVAILNRAKEVFCGGTLVAPQWVITAAHCLRKRLYVRLAEHDLAITDGREVEFKITETVAHPLYDSTTVDNDVALLRLPQAVEVGTKMSPVCLPHQGTPLPVGKQCTIIGWGKERHSHFFGTEVLNEAEVPIIDEDLCRKVYDDYYITQNMFCAGHRKGRVDSCAGDSGGPLLCHKNGRWYIYGITSFGEGCGRRGKFGIYARVSNYRAWVNDVIAAHAHRAKYPSTSKRKQRRRHAKHRDYQKRRQRKRD